jgi:hypothetical protein
MYLLFVHNHNCLFERFVNMYLFSMFVNNHICCALVLLFGTNCPYECRNNWCLLSDVWYFTFLQSLFFLGWNYMCLGIEPLFDLSIFTAVDKVKDRILYNKVWKDNWTYFIYLFIYLGSSFDGGYPKGYCARLPNSYFIKLWVFEKLLWTVFFFFFPCLHN